MALTKLGKYIKQSDTKNRDNAFDESAVVGLSTSKVIMKKTKADLDGVSLTTYYTFPQGNFAYVPDTSRRGEKVSLGYNTDARTHIVSGISSVFYVSDTEALLPDYLFMFFNRPEFDRYARFNSWGSARETFNWDDLCDMDIELPSIEEQRRVAAVYTAMKANQEVYERGLEDLKLVCDAYIEDLRRKMLTMEIGGYIYRFDRRNSDNSISNVMGISVFKEYRLPTSKVNTAELATYKIVKPRQIGFVQTTHNERVFAFAFNNTDKDIVVSSVNEVFSTDETRLLPEYLSMWFSRTEFDRYARFHSWGSARETFTWMDLCEVKLPIPDIKMQQAIVDIYNAYMMRRKLNERLKSQIKDLCPILIKGSIKGIMA